MAQTVERSSGKRADARRNESVLLEAAARVFIDRGVDAPMREIARAAGVGTATIYRHFPTRADLIIAVYRHQVDALADERPTGDPYEALRTWIAGFVDFLVTKHGLASALQSDDECFDPLHKYFLDRLVPVCGELVSQAQSAGQVTSEIDGLHLMRAIGGLCASATTAHDYNARSMVEFLVAGLRV